MGVDTCVSLARVTLILSTLRSGCADKAATARSARAADACRLSTFCCLPAFGGLFSPETTGEVTDVEPKTFSRDGFGVATCRRRYWGEHGTSRCGTRSQARLFP